MRYPDWDRRLVEYIQARRNVPFCWSTNNCCLYAADGILAITGEDRLGDWRAKCCSEIGAAKLILRHGGLRGATSVKLGRFESIMGRANRGDIALVRSLDQEWLGIVTGSVVTACEHTSTPLREAVCFWPIK